MIQLRITKYNTQASVHYKGRHTGIIQYEETTKKPPHPQPRKTN
jgi:hypothetical protein